MVGRRLACRDAADLLGPLKCGWTTYVPLDHLVHEIRWSKRTQVVQPHASGPTELKWSKQESAAMNPPAAPRPAPPTRPHHRPLNNLPGFGAPHWLQAGAVPVTVLVSITSPPGPAPGRRRPGPACVMRAQRDGIHPSSRHARSARRNPPALDPREPTSHNASPDDITDSTPPGRAPGRPRAIRPPGSAGFAPGARWGEGRSSSADDRAINGSSGCVGDGPVRGRPPPGRPDRPSREAPSVTMGLASARGARCRGGAVPSSCSSRPPFGPRCRSGAGRASPGRAGPGLAGPGRADVVGRGYLGRLVDRKSVV